MFCKAKHGDPIFIRHSLKIPACLPLFFIFFGTVFPCSAQIHQKVETWYDNHKHIRKELYFVLKNKPSVLDSIYTSYFHNGRVKVKGNYRNNKANGLWVYFYENGEVKMRGLLRDNLNEGLWTFYFENGNPIMEGQMEKGKKEGEWKYFYENGNLKTSGIYLHDQKDGYWNYYFEDGGFKAQADFEKGRGVYKEFYPDGAVKSEGNIIDGQSDGIWKYYYEDETLKAEGYEKAGLKEGMWKFYHPNGKLASEGLYVKGQPEGSWKYYYEDGNLSSEGDLLQGHKNGYWKLYYKNGSFKGEGNFVNGKGLYKEYYENGKLKSEGLILDNKNEGTWKYYYETGELEGECYFTRGNGKYTGYYPDGGIKMRGLIEGGDKVGIWELFKEDGTLAGYYKTYYEDNSPVFAPVDSLKKMAKQDTALPYQKPELKIPKKKSRYFTRKINEFNGFILSTSPLAPLFSSIPFSFEYYLQERLGFEVNYTFIKAPLLKGAPIDQESKQGFSVYFRQKFYQPDREHGMYYFGHEFRYSMLDHRMNYADSSIASVPVKHLQVNEQLYEYSIIVGNRMMRDAHSSGYTFDIFAGIGIGYRVLSRNYNGTGFDKLFNHLHRGKISVPVRIGINFGYAFDKKKVFKALGWW